MAAVVDALKLAREKKRLPTKAFFIDTNVVIDYVDPFSRSLELPAVARRNAQIREVVSYLKSTKQQAYCTTGVALEYYKHIQVSFYQVETEKVLNTEDFKRLRDTNIDFMNRREGQLTEFKKVFTKRFPLYNVHTSISNLISDFNGSLYDFGDHLLFKSVVQCDQKLRCIFSNDADFLSFPDDIFLLTTNKKIIAKHREEE